MSAYFGSNLTPNANANASCKGKNTNNQNSLNE